MPASHESDGRLQPDGRIVVLIPVYNDWQAVGQLLDELAEALAESALTRVSPAGSNRPVTVVLVDDGSTEEWDPDRLRPRGPIERIRLLRLRRNLGHQRAIAIGLTHVYEELPSSYCVVMDGDGEDNPADIPKLLLKASENDDRKVVFAERSRRSESWWFRLGYRCYRVLHWLLTGVPVRVGNYSVIPARSLERIVVVSELWNHYAAAVFKSRIPYATVPSARRPRLSGESSMSLVSLITHGLSAISVFGDVVGVRLLIATLMLSALALAAQTVALLSNIESLISQPAQAVESIAFLALGILQAVVVVALFVFVILSGRQNPSFLPLRDYSYFILDATEL